jgi:hypothetical protein
MKLLASQKKIIDRYIIAGSQSYEDIPEAVWKQIVAIKDYETIHWDVDRYMNDRAFEMQRKEYYPF